MKTLLSLVALTAFASWTSSQMSIGPWATTTLGPGCAPPLSCTTCATASTVLGAGNSLLLQSTSSTPNNVFPVSTCSTGIDLTATMTIGTAGGGTKVMLTSLLTGSLDTKSLFGSTGCSASVKLDGTPIADHGSFLNPFPVLVPISDLKESACLLLAPGTYTLDVCLQTISTSPLSSPPPPVLNDTSDFQSPGNGLAVLFVDGGPADTVMATTVEFNSCFPNPDHLMAEPAIVGKDWSVSLALGFNRTPSFWRVYFGSSLVAPPCGIAIPSMFGGLNFGPPSGGRILLCSLQTSALSLGANHDGVLSHVSTATGHIPCDPRLIGIPWCGQALVLGAVAAADGGGNARLSSGLLGVVGSF